MINQSKFCKAMKRASGAMLVAGFIVACTGSPISQHNEQDTTSAYLKVDSLTFSEQKAALSDELVQLRDSIDTLLLVVKSKPVQNDEDSVGVNNAVKELSLNRDLVERHLQEVGLTSENSWYIHDIKRIKLDMKKIRREYARIDTTFTRQSK